MQLARFIPKGLKTREAGFSVLYSSSVAEPITPVQVFVYGDTSTDSVYA